MLTFPAGVRIFFATRPTDLRKSYDGLSALVDNELGMQPTSGDLFIFVNRRATQVRILFWDRDGYCVMMKRLERGTFRRIESSRGETHVEIEGAQLAMLLEGIDAQAIRRRKRYRRPSVAKARPLDSEKQMIKTTHSYA